jgi:GDPmannose 4,6-dehydratase
MAVARIVLGMQKKLYLGNLSAKRDWGHAKDYVRAMYLMLQQDEPEDFVIATGVTTMVKDFVGLAFAEAGVEVKFEGEGLLEKGIVVSCSNVEHMIAPGTVVVEVDPAYFRPTEVDLLLGNPAKAKAKLGWVPEHDLGTLVKDMIDNDIKLARKEKYLKDGGFRVMNYFE